MKLYIQDVCWEINRVTGEKTERVAFAGEVPCEVGDLKEISSQYRIFAISETGEKSVTIFIGHANNPTADRYFTLKKGGSEVYAPRSFGAGHIYKFKLQ